MTTFDLRLRQPNIPLGTHPGVYWWRRHLSQWWSGWHGRHLRWLCVRWSAAASVAIPLLFVGGYVEAVRALPAIATEVRLAAATPVLRGQAESQRVTPLAVQSSIASRFTRRGKRRRRRTMNRRGWASQVGAFLIMPAVALAVGFRYVAAQTWYETNRPTLPAPTATYYVDSGAAGGGDGTLGAPFNSLTSVDNNSNAGALFYLKGTFAASIRPVSTGTASNWIAYKVWPGYACTITGDGTYDLVWLAQSAREYFWIEGLALNAYAGNYDGLAVAHSYAGARGPVVVMDCTTVGGVQVIQASGSWIEGGSARNWGGRSLPMGPTAKVTATLAGAGAGNVDNGAHRYRVKFLVAYSDPLVTSTTDRSPAGDIFDVTNAYTAATSDAVTTTAGDGKVQLSNIPLSGHTNCSARELYRLVVGGTVTTSADWKLLTTINDNVTTTYLDNTADASLGAAITNAQGNAGTAINVLNSSHNTVVYGVDVGRGGHGGIEVGFGGSYSGDRSANVRIAFNTVRNEWAGGIGVGQCDDIIVEANVVSHTARVNDDGLRHIGTTQGVLISGYRPICRYNRITETWGQGLVLQSQLTSQSLTCIDSTIVFNVVTGCYGAGFLFFNSGDIPSTGHTVANNIFWNNCGGGLIEEYETYGYYNGAIYEMWVYSSGLTGASLAAWYPSGVTTLGPSNLIANNVVGTSPQTLVHVRPSGNGGTQSNTLAEMESRYPTQFVDNVSSDPLFVSTTIGNANFCAIPSNSPAKDAGAVVGGYSSIGPAPDVGVYEVG